MPESLLNKSPRSGLHTGLLNMLEKAENLYQQALTEARKENFNVQKTLNLLNSAIEAGSPDAAYALATWYLHGEHVGKDWNKAVFLLKRASNAKNPDALYDLAVCYEEGKGIKQDKYKAFELYLQAALRGDQQSIHEVGRCYYYGIGIEEDKDLADIWLERAEELGL